MVPGVRLELVDRTAVGVSLGQKAGLRLGLHVLGNLEGDLLGRCLNGFDLGAGGKGYQSRSCED